MDRAEDIAILERAVEEHRVIITADLDFPRLLAIMESTGPGQVLFRGGNFSEAEVLDRLSAVLRTVPHEELPRCVVVMERFRIRCRWLPLES